MRASPNVLIEVEYRSYTQFCSNLDSGISDVIENNKTEYWLKLGNAEALQFDCGSLYHNREQPQSIREFGREGLYSLNLGNRQGCII